ncbi:MAG: hypothetical protein A2X12_09975 [Bacteroidetes bacterium GWE2_29_8]|nr:MAG: hypothetical protein A2X12_09975 [Bacteroidetes bacterium GWE2_29_8]OFY20029.1 MAG: hypothetical protein A2X02_06600 [Bacteroidetes bacterium GWF2_29_10]
MTCNLKYIFIVITTAFVTQSLNAQNIKPSRFEKAWALKHIFVANKAKKISKEASTTSLQIKENKILDFDDNGGFIDAFRHSYWMARLTQEIGQKKAIKLGVAHEKKNYKDFKKRISTTHDSVSIQMDLLNNQIGSQIGIEYKELPKEKLIELIVQQVKNGNMFIIQKDTLHNSLDINGNIINNADWQGIYVNKRCLIKSKYPFTCIQKK